LQYECPCCGTFLLTDTGLTTAQSEPHQSRRYLLSSATRRASDRGRPLRLTADTVTELLQSALRPRTPYDVLDPLLLAIHDGLTEVYGHVRIPYVDFPLFAVRGPAQLKESLRHLENMRLVEVVEDPATQSFECRLRLPGWDRVAKLRRDGHPSARAFVAMAAAAELRPAFDDGISRALTEAGWTPVRIDLLEPAEHIDDHTVAEIRRSGLLVADLTEQSRGVYFAAGLAVGLGIPVIWTVRKGDLAAAPFDARHYDVIDWVTPDDLRRRLVDRLLATAPPPVA
jgi:hypothetical protein